MVISPITTAESTARTVTATAASGDQTTIPRSQAQSERHRWLRPISSRPSVHEGSAVIPPMSTPGGVLGQVLDRPAEIGARHQPERGQANFLAEVIPALPGPLLSGTSKSTLISHRTALVSRNSSFSTRRLTQPGCDIGSDAFA
ncbi:MAG TPA: hypothetical protein VN767_10390 [Streptosporangiaceae bacterium]|nr:hypothetical protein [Streptosporangiaceae bacterium]